MAMENAVDERAGHLVPPPKYKQLRYTGEPLQAQYFPQDYERL